MAYVRNKYMDLLRDKRYLKVCTYMKACSDKLFYGSLVICRSPCHSDDSKVFCN